MGHCSSCLWSHTCAAPTIRWYRSGAGLCVLWQLASAEEYVDGTFTGNLGEVLIRCNNVLYLRGVPEEEEEDTTGAEMNGNGTADMKTDME